MVNVLDIAGPKWERHKILFRTDFPLLIALHLVLLFLYFYFFCLLCSLSWMNQVLWCLGWRYQSGVVQKKGDNLGWNSGKQWGWIYWCGSLGKLVVEGALDMQGSPHLRRMCKGSTWASRREREESRTEESSAGQRMRSTGSRRIKGMLQSKTSRNNRQTEEQESLIMEAREGFEKNRVNYLKGCQVGGWREAEEFSN